MKMKSLYRSLMSTLAISHVATGMYVDEFLLNDDSIHHIRIILRLSQDSDTGAEAEDAEGCRASAASLSSFVEEKEVEAAKTLSLLEALDRQVGGDPNIPLLDRLAYYTQTLHAASPTLHDALTALSSRLREIPGMDRVKKVEHLRTTLTTRQQTQTQDVSPLQLKSPTTPGSTADQPQPQPMIPSKSLRNSHPTPRENPDAKPHELKAVDTMVPETKTPGKQTHKFKAKSFSSETPSLSTHQQALLKCREEKKIGDHAWALLGGKNANLAAAVHQSILQYPGQTVEIFQLDVDYFTLLVDGKRQRKLYKTK